MDVFLIQFFFVHLQRIEIYGVLPWLDHNSQPKTEDKEPNVNGGPGSGGKSLDKTITHCMSMPNNGTKGQFNPWGLSAVVQVMLKSILYTVERHTSQPFSGHSPEGGKGGALTKG